MPCEPFRRSDGSTGLMCTRGRQPRPRCTVCGVRAGTRLCDAVLEAQHTCDAPLCPRCTQRVGVDGDRCPEHRVSRLAPTRQGTFDFEGEEEG